MEKKKNSIEWLFEQVWINPVSKLPEIFEQAKAMHKEEVISTYKNAMSSSYFNTHNWMPQEGYIHKAEQYYNETFGGDNE